MIEVLLAMGIAAGILTVVLFFYRQTESLRGRLLEETTRISAARMVMERLTMELGTVTRRGSSDFSGSADRIQFVRFDFPQSVSTNRGGAVPESPFSMVSYSLSQGTNTDESGLMRSEEFLAGKTSAISTNDDLVLKTGGAQNRRFGTLVPQVQYLRFRYWDGTNWIESWNSGSIPSGVEVSLGCEPMPAETEPTEEYPYELYRRVIYVPNHTVSPTNSTDGATVALLGGGL